MVTEHKIYHTWMYKKLKSNKNSKEYFNMDNMKSNGSLETQSNQDVNNADINSDM